LSFVTGNLGCRDDRADAGLSGLSVASANNTRTHNPLERSR
jgi:hypothetical protein